MFAAQDDGHFPCDLPRRRAARLLLCDADERVLLLRHEPPLHVLHWAGPGGGLDTGESPEQALRRELAEELALTVELALEPAGEWRHVFPYHGVLSCNMRSCSELIFPDGVTPESVLLGRQARADGISGLRWWTAAGLQEAEEDVWPEGLRYLGRTRTSGSPVIAGKPEDRHLGST